MLENLVPVEPVHFFALQLPCLQTTKKSLEKQHRLPALEQLYGEKFFATVSLGWHKEGIAICVKSPSLKTSHFPDIQAGDSVELFFDTRDVKTTGYPTRFCHHFFFLPDGQAGEITRVRTDDAHPLCDPELLKAKCDGKEMTIWIPKEALFGYEPAQFKRVGFTYRINRTDKFPQYFTISDEDFAIEKHPAFWASMELK